MTKGKAIDLLDLIREGRCLKDLEADELVDMYLGLECGSWEYLVVEDELELRLKFGPPKNLPSVQVISQRATKKDSASVRAENEAR